MDVNWMRDAYEAANDGDWKAFRERVSADYVHHVPSMGIDWKGADDAVAGLLATYASLDLSQHAVDVAEHGPYVVVSVTATSNLRSNPFEGVHVYRTDGDMIVEAWALYPPMA